ncbi:hypothetical protein OG21DRAFT_1421878 [Imleria badia]|nr:hypothetical protein OG21DRAFT_1421878 [Imleria badia]
MGYGLLLYRKIVPQSYGLWGMGCGCKFPANQLGKSKKLWVIREYGLYGVWVTRESTVPSRHNYYTVRERYQEPDSPAEQSSNVIASRRFANSPVTRKPSHWLVST